MNVENGLSVLADGIEEFADNEEVSATVRSLGDELFVGIVPFGEVVLEGFLTLGGIPRVVAQSNSAAVAAAVFRLTVFTAYSVRVVMCSKARTACYAVNGIVVVEAGYDRGTVVYVAIGERAFGIGIVAGHSRNANGECAGDIHKRC